MFAKVMRKDKSDGHFPEFLMMLHEALGASLSKSIQDECNKLIEKLSE